MGTENQHGGRECNDLQNLLDMTSQENPLYGFADFHIPSTLHAHSPFETQSQGFPTSKTWLHTSLSVNQSKGRLHGAKLCDFSEKKKKKT